MPSYVWTVGARAMLDWAGLQTLSAWCNRHELSWTATAKAGGNAVMVLRAAAARRPWQRMLLVMENDELRLENEIGETLASASDLPALLDALEGGVAEPAWRQARVGVGV